MLLTVRLDERILTQIDDKRRVLIGLNRILSVLIGLTGSILGRTMIIVR